MTTQILILVTGPTLTGKHCLLSFSVGVRTSYCSHGTLAQEVFHQSSSKNKQAHASVCLRRLARCARRQRLPRGIASGCGGQTKQFSLKSQKLPTSFCRRKLLSLAVACTAYSAAVTSSCFVESTTEGAACWEAAR